jgi:hypothetical protein
MALVSWLRAGRSHSGMEIIFNPSRPRLFSWGTAVTMGQLLLGEQTMCKNMFTILAPACLAAQTGPLPRHATAMSTWTS